LGFSHIGLTVPNVGAAVERLVAHGGRIMKALGTPDDPLTPAGAEIAPAFRKILEKLAFVLDPDGYWIEV